MKRRWLANRQSMVLGTFALIIACALTAINSFTRPAINNNRQLQLDRQLTEVLPHQQHDNQLQRNPKTLVDPISGETRTLYVATKNNQPVAAVITALAPDGYSGDITLLVGILADGSLSGVRVTHHSETPGLGDDIELAKSAWILQFDGKSLSQPVRWAVRRDGGDFDQLTGATITPRAIVRAVHRTLTFFHTNKQQIFSP